MNSSSTRIEIVGTGAFAPGEPISNAALSKVMDTDDEWIAQRTGIRQRHYAAPGQSSSDLALHASQQAIANAGLTPHDIDYVLFATMTPDLYFPGSGPSLASKLGITGTPTLDIRQQCCSYPYALQVANALVASGAANTVLIASADNHASTMPYDPHTWDVLRGATNAPVSDEARARNTKHRGVAVIFGDGASSMVVRASASPDRGYIDTQVHSNGEMNEGVCIRGLGSASFPYVSKAMLDDDMHIIAMNGRSLFKSAVKLLGSTITELCAKHGLTPNDVDVFIGHQANQRINDAVTQALRLDPAKVPSNIDRYGNTSSATIGILTHELVKANKLQTGELVCFFALGAGLTWGATLLRW